MENNIEITNKAIAAFREILDKRGISYDLNQNDGNMIRFRTQLPSFEGVTPYVIIHYNEENGALSLALTGIATFIQGDPDIYKLVNDFNADPANFACKMFVEPEGHIDVLTNAIINKDDVCELIEEYLKINILATDKYYGQIADKIAK